MQQALSSKHLQVFQRLVASTALLCFALIMIGAWVRLTDAGLGCPDWPGCYGKLTPIQAKAEIAAAVAEQGGEHGPVSLGKAWREMIHRYIAAGLGLLILLISALAWRWRQELGQSPLLAAATLGVVILQGLFGMWTVTLLLKPAIVTIHLLGGLLSFSLLFWLWLRTRQSHRETSGEARRPETIRGASASHSESLLAHRVLPAVRALPAMRALPARPEHQALPALRALGAIAILVVAAQIALGGWTSTNYAALACADFPSCQGSWWPAVNFADAFHVIRELGKTSQGDAIDLPALTAIHLSHRLGAVVVLLVVGLLGWRCLKLPSLKASGALLLGMLLVQWGLGISNVVFQLPLWVAVAHTGGAVVLLALVLLINFRLASEAVRLQADEPPSAVLTAMRKSPGAIG